MGRRRWTFLGKETEEQGERREGFVGIGKENGSRYDWESFPKECTLTTHSLSEGSLSKLRKKETQPTSFRAVLGSPIIRKLDLRDPRTLYFPCSFPIPLCSVLFDIRSQTNEVDHGSRNDRVDRRY